MAARNSQPLEVLWNVNLTVDSGQFVAIVGPSGCGKSTLLNIIAGLERPTRGEVKLKGDAAAERLGIVAYMHQRDLLLPWRSVVDNAGLALELRGTPGSEARERVRFHLDRFGLAGFGDAYPATLSGGMRQRVALLRAMLPEQDVLLLDEPFGALDALTRSSMHEWLDNILESSGRAVLLVTHDVEEAVLLSDRVHVMTARPGTVEGTVEIDLPRPRSREMTTETAFVGFKAQLLELLFGARGKAA